MFALSKFARRSKPFAALRICFSTTPPPTNRGVSTANVRVSIENDNDVSKEQQTATANSFGDQNGPPVKDAASKKLVEAVFESLKQLPKADDDSKTKLLSKDVRLKVATTVNELLDVIGEGIISRRHALKVVSTLAEWSSSKKVKLSDFETDPRFLKVCRILSREQQKKSELSISAATESDLSMVLGVTGDDEAAKLVASITLPQMVKVMATLAQRKRRSTPLLRSLAYNVSRNKDKLNIKQCADILYGMAVLNFPDSMLFDKVSAELTTALEDIKDKSSVVGSVIRSIGLLRYKNPSVLDTLSEWILTHHEICRPQDICSLFLTLAMVSYEPQNAEQLYQTLVPQLNIKETTKSSSWLDIVWSMLILNQATEEHIASVLNPVFLTQLQSDNMLSVFSKIKLLNINAAAELLFPNYKGPTLAETSNIRAANVTQPTSKQTLVAAMLDSLGSLMSSITYLKTHIDTGMGFYIDGYCVLDKKGNPLPVSLAKTENIRVAIMAYDYYDMCHGKSEPHGGNILAARLLRAQGYKVMEVPYTEFNPRDKLVHRVQYLETKLKTLVREAQ